MGDHNPASHLAVRTVLDSVRLDVAVSAETASREAAKIAKLGRSPRRVEIGVAKHDAATLYFRLEALAPVALRQRIACIDWQREPQNFIGGRGVMKRFTLRNVLGDLPQNFATLAAFWEPPMTHLSDVPRFGPLVRDAEG